MEGTGIVQINATATGGNEVVGTLTYKNCEWVDGGNKPLPQWSLANCSAIGKTVVGFHFLKSNNQEENTEYEVTPDYVRARRVSDGSYMHAWAYCCNIETVVAAPPAPAPSTCYTCASGCPSGLISRGAIGKGTLLTCNGGGYPGCASGDVLYCFLCCTA
jgi:hypothetical protein